MSNAPEPRSDDRSHPARCSGPAARPSAKGYWRLVAAGEPFRLLIPTGALIGLIGVMTWPLYAWSVTGEPACTQP
ncbi:MAG: hypothetical protein WCH98_07465 [Verrucomicrobiota bacterium]